MAKLFDDKLELEISYLSYAHGWVEYGFDCRWDGEPIFSGKPLKRSPRGRISPGPGQMRGNEHEACCVLPFLNDLLQTQAPDYVTPIEPDFTLAIWPHDSFPFLPPKEKVVHVRDDYRRELKARAAAREQAGGLLDDDAVQLILAFDASQYPKTSYLGSGPALHMEPTWGALREFAESLRGEFREFAKRHDMLTRMEANGFLGDAAIQWWRRLIMDDDWKLGIDR